ncbi:microsomal glutathione S-transferase 3-like protein [Scenedesmus sp. NREL 46B-D3]|nr:microsomal glutathione S-transferase 3-like protein [Scenedesmus sp. NREL 46B-D3]
MGAVVAIKPGFGYVLGTACASYFVHHMYMSFKVVKARKQFGVEYPALYADNSNCSDEKSCQTFNCVQRAHQNSLENQPIFLALLTLSGLQYPVTAATFGGLYLAGRIGYVQGYSTGDPQKRVNYLTALGYVGIFGLVGTSIKFAADLLSK